MLPVLQIGPLAVQLPGLVLLAGLWLGLALAERESARLRLGPESVYNMTFAGLVAGLAGARLAHAARYLDAYLSDPASLFSLSPAALVPDAGLLAGVLAAGVYGARRRMPLRETLEALAPAAAVLAAALALAHLASGDAFGAPARLPWSIYLWDAYRHPAQIYELGAALAVLGLWRWQRDQRPYAGFGFLLVVAGLAAGRVFLEAFRGDSQLFGHGLRVAQAQALALLGLSLAAMRAWRPAAGKEI